MYEVNAPGTGYPCRRQPLCPYLLPLQIILLSYLCSLTAVSWMLKPRTWSSQTCRNCKRTCETEPTHAALVFGFHNICLLDLRILTLIKQYIGQYIHYIFFLGWHLNFREHVLPLETLNYILLVLSSLLILSSCPCLFLTLLIISFSGSLWFVWKTIVKSPICIWWKRTWTIIVVLLRQGKNISKKSNIKKEEDNRCDGDGGSLAYIM